MEDVFFHNLLKRNFIIPIRLLRDAQVSGAVGVIFPDFIVVIPRLPHNGSIFELPLDDPFKLLPCDHLDGDLRWFCQ